MYLACVYLSYWSMFSSFSFDRDRNRVYVEKHQLHFVCITHRELWTPIYNLSVLENYRHHNREYQTSSQRHLHPLLSLYLRHSDNPLIYNLSFARTMKASFVKYLIYTLSGKNIETNINSTLKNPNKGSSSNHLYPFPSITYPSTTSPPPFPHPSSAPPNPPPYTSQTPAPPHPPP